MTTVAERPGGDAGAVGYSDPCFPMEVARPRPIAAVRGLDGMMGA